MVSTNPFDGFRFIIGQTLALRASVECGEPNPARLIVVARRVEEHADGRLSYDYMVRLHMPGTAYEIADTREMLQDELAPHPAYSEPLIKARRRVDHFAMLREDMEQADRRRRTPPPDICETKIGAAPVTPPPTPSTIGH